MNIQRVPNHILDKLKSVEKRAKFENASFGFKRDTVRVNTVFDSSEPQSLDGFVKEQTRLYRETWLIPEIRAIIDWAEGVKS